MNGGSEQKASFSHVPYLIVMSNNKKASPSQPPLPQEEKPKQPHPPGYQSNIKGKHNNSNIQKDSGPGSGTPDQVANYECVMFASRDLLVQQEYSVEECQKSQGGNP